MIFEGKLSSANKRPQLTIMALPSTDPYNSPQGGSIGTKTPIQGLRRRRRGLTSPQVKSPVFYTAYTAREYRDMLRDSPNSLSPRAFDLDSISSVSPHHRGPHRDGFTEESECIVHRLKDMEH
jgi:hypothetical protein